MHTFIRFNVRKDSHLKKRPWPHAKTLMSWMSEK